MPTELAQLERPTLTPAFSELGSPALHNLPQTSLAADSFEETSVKKSSLRKSSFEKSSLKEHSLEAYRFTAKSFYQDSFDNSNFYLSSFSFNNYSTTSLQAASFQQNNFQQNSFQQTSFRNRSLQTNSFQTESFKAQSFQNHSFERRPCTTELAQRQARTCSTELAELHRRTFESPTSSFQLRTAQLCFGEASLPCGGLLRTAGPQGGVLRDSFSLLPSLAVDKLELGALPPWLKLLSLSLEKELASLSLADFPYFEVFCGKMHQNAKMVHVVPRAQKFTKSAPLYKSATYRGVMPCSSS